MKKKLLIIGVIVMAAVAVAGYNIIYKDHRDINKETAEFELTAAKLSGEFIASEPQANAKYADKTIVVSGNITGFDKASGTVTIDDILSATLLEKNTPIEQQKTVKIKGRFVGYDDLLGELKMDQVTLIK